jgi:hypothetical protein
MVHLLEANDDKFKRWNIALPYERLYDPFIVFV